MPELGPWECAAAPWFLERPQLDKVWTASGPKDWKRIDIKQLADTTETPIVPTQVTDVHEVVDSISFHVSETGKPVLVRTSYFPNWKVSGAEGPYRVAPNFMVVVPTRNDVRLTYGLTKYEWLGRFGTLLGIIGVGLLIVWKGAERFGALRDDDASPEGGEGGDDDPDRRDDAALLSAPEGTEPENSALDRS
jgi:hypothetical protein